MYGLTPEAAEARQATTFEAIQREVGSCGEWVEEKNTRCGAPSEHVLWGKLLPAEALGPRCYDCAAKHIGRTLADPTYALLDLWRLARVIDEAHLAAYRCPGGGVSEPERVEYARVSSVVDMEKAVEAIADHVEPCIGVGGPAELRSRRREEAVRIAREALGAALPHIRRSSDE